jgi:hypothetical protein
MNLNSYITRAAAAAADPFPCLMEVGHGGFVVLFNAPGSGTVVASNGAVYDIGHHSDDWAMQVFVPFRGSVTIGDSDSVAPGGMDDNSRPEFAYVGGEPLNFGFDFGTPGGDMSAAAAVDANGRVVGFGPFDSGNPIFGNSEAVPCGAPGCCPSNPATSADVNPADELGDDVPPQVREVFNALRGLGVKVEVLRVR